MAEISIKNKDEIAIMRQSGRIAAFVLNKVAKAVKPGVSIIELDKMAEKLILEAGAKPAFKGHCGYPAATCISINDEVVHAVPSARKIREGDLVAIDLGVLFKGYNSDTAVTIGVGKIDGQAKKLIDITRKSLDEGIKKIKPGNRLGDMQEVIQQTVEVAGFGVVRDLSGHGIGKTLQESPSIPNFGEKGKGIMFHEGMVIAVEPMVTKGDWHVKTLDDGWTVVTKDGSLAAHFEHTIAVTKNGSEILTSTTNHN